MRDIVDLAAIAAVGAQLRHAGLTTRALAAWAGTARVSALPARLDAVSGPQTPAGVLLALLVAGAEVERDRLRTRSRPLPDTPRNATPDALDALIDQLLAWELVECTANRLRAQIAILPLGSALLVCDRLDAGFLQVGSVRGNRRFTE